jgi:uncharacterized NAD(P)/FAD-binding protein YdhS
MGTRMQGTLSSKPAAGERSGPVRHVAIIGGGFSGTLLAVNLLRHGGPAATIIEPAEAVGRGLAYGATSPLHLLNVRARNMSALPDDPGHFLAWLERETGHCGADFVPRRTYGRYIGALLAESLAAAEGRATVVRGRAVHLAPDASGYRITLADGQVVTADAAVLAVGNLPPYPPAGLDPEALPRGAYLEDPWGQDLADGLAPEDSVLLLGSGLTAVDVALLLREEGFAGRILITSRRGLLPRPHVEEGPVPPLDAPPRPVVRAVVRHLRDAAAAIGWRAAIDQLRPHSQALWQKFPLAERRRFLRHARPWWDVHRHRLAPAVAADLKAMLASGQVVLRPGRTLAIAPDGEAMRVEIAPRGGGAPAHLRVARIINCTGPTGDLGRSPDPLLRTMAADGLVRADPLRLGLDVDPVGRVIDAAGRAAGHLYAVGPMTRGTFWEITAVPDIRAQVWTVGRRLSHAHWVGGEGL